MQIDNCSYTRVNWKNKETALTTPVNANNLNQMDSGINTIKEHSNLVGYAVNKLIQDLSAIKIVDSEEDLPDVGENGTLYLVLEAESEEET